MISSDFNGNAVGISLNRSTIFQMSNDSRCAVSKIVQRFGEPVIRSDRQPQSSGISSDSMQRRMVWKNKRSRLSTVCLHESIPIPYPIVLLIACTRLIFTGFWKWYRNKVGEVRKCGRDFEIHPLTWNLFAVATSKKYISQKVYFDDVKVENTFSERCYFQCIAAFMAL